MKYSININQRATAEYNKKYRIKLSETDMAIFEYLFWICMSPSNKVISKRIEINNISFTWINYKHLLSEMPIISVKSLSKLSRIINKLEKAKLIKTEIKSKGTGRMKYVKISERAEELFSDVYDRLE